MAGSSGARGREGLERNWKSTVLERFAIEIFSKDLDRNVSMSRSDGFAVLYQEIRRISSDR